MNFNREYKGKELFYYPDEYVSLDIETTGLNSLYDSIIEVGAIKVKNGEIIDTFSTLINPLREIPYNITKITGLYTEDVIDAKTFDQIADDLLNFIGDYVILGQNIKFDLSFLFVNFHLLNIELKNDYVDLLRISRQNSPELSSHKLGVVAKNLNVSYLGAHRAINDAIITYKCYEKYKEKSYEVLAS